MVNRGVSSTDDSDSEDELSESEAPKNLDMLGCESQIKEPINKKNHALHNTQVTRFHSDISLDLGFQDILIPFHTRNYHSFGVS